MTSHIIKYTPDLHRFLLLIVVLNFKYTQGHPRPHKVFIKCLKILLLLKYCQILLCILVYQLFLSIIKTILARQMWSVMCLLENSVLCEPTIVVIHQPIPQVA
jgi:hypothetical protein